MTPEEIQRFLLDAILTHIESLQEEACHSQVYMSDGTQVDHDMIAWSSCDVKTFEQAGLLSDNKGLEIQLGDHIFQVQIIQKQ